jgi:hypothetical protein
MQTIGKPTRHGFSYLPAPGARLRRVLWIAVPLVALPATAVAQGAWTPPPGWFTYGVIGIVVVGAIVSMLLVRAALAAAKTWSLSDALSEETEVSSIVDGKPQINAATNEPVTVILMMASTSRLIAFMGMLVLILMFVGFGSFALYGFAVSGTLPASIDQVGKFLLAGMTLFAPYAVNKFAGVFESLGGGNKKS